MKKTILTNYVINKERRLIFFYSALLFLFCNITYAHETFSQDLLSQPITLNEQSVDMRKVLSDIEKQSTVKFVFSNNAIKAANKVTVTAVSEQLSSVLNKLLSPFNVSYELVGSRILLKKTDLKSTSSLQDERINIDNSVVGSTKSALSAQLATFTISGVVTDEKNETLIGASVVLEGTSKGTVTDENGAFKLDIDDSEKNGALLISFVGYDKVRVEIKGQNALNVIMKEAGTLNEVVVVGYGTQKKGDLTGAVSKYKNDNLDEIPVARLDQALQGKIAGVSIQNVGTTPGAEPTIRIRGLSSVNAGANPLIVVDGHPVPDGLSYLNSADVESIEVLKDAASAAIYGSRGASGVILVTTRSGRPDKTRFFFKSSSGVSQAYKIYPILTTSDYVKRLFDEAAIRATDPSILPANNVVSATDRAAYVIENQQQGGNSTDWESQAIRSATNQTIQFGATGGNKDLLYYISGGYQNNQGTQYHSEYQKYSIFAKLDATLSKRVKLSLNLNPTLIKTETPGIEFNDFARWRSFMPVYLDEPTAAFVRQNPLYADVKAGDFAQARYWSGRVYSGQMPDGSTWVNTATVDPFATNNQQPKSVLESRKITNNIYRVMSSGDITVNILPGLDFKSLASAYLSYTDGLDFSKTNATKAGNPSTGIYTNNSNFDLLNENTFDYKKTIGNHTIGLLAGFTEQVTKLNTSKITGTNYSSDDITTLNTALGIDISNSGTTRNTIGLLSYLGRATYAYKDKYLVSASYRADGSTYFAPGKQWGYFPAISAGWVASEEGFLKKVDWLSRLKVRASFGATGNNRIIDFAYLDLLYPNNYPLGAGTGTTTQGQSTTNSNAVTPSNGINTNILSNPNITWERTFQFNSGLDLSLFNNRFIMSLDVYQSKTDQLLLKQSSLAFTGVQQTWNNIGSLQNNGIELELTAVAISNRNFKWVVQGNISHNENKVLELGAETQLLNQGERTELYLNKVGAPFVQFYGYKTDGVWISQQQITESGLKSNLSSILAPGGLKVVDVNGDGVLDEKDRVVIGNPYPDFIYGLNNKFIYKGIDFGFTIQGSQGGKLINGDPNYAEIRRTGLNYNSPNKWLSPLNPGDGKTPYYTTGFNWMLTDYVVEDASYWAVRDVVIGYSFPAKWMKAANIRNLRLYASAQNLYYHTATGYRGLNPEGRFQTGPYSTPLVDGYQRGTYPITTSYRFGVDLTF